MVENSNANGVYIIENLCVPSGIRTRMLLVTESHIGLTKCGNSSLDSDTTINMQV